MENNNLFFNLPIDLQDKIIKMNPHPLVSIFNEGYHQNFILELRQLIDINFLWYRVGRNKW